jgi:hypothetical protein
LVRTDYHWIMSLIGLSGGYEWNLEWGTSPPPKERHHEKIGITPHLSTRRKQKTPPTHTLEQRSGMPAKCSEEETGHW